uniref:Uncharacterized protein n=1 Tax=Lepeophtheirus salmonis TaxID=72036 RepID=A0A0K2TPV8_LEPSM
MITILQIRLFYMSVETSQLFEYVRRI